MTQPPRHQPDREVIVTERSSGAGMVVGVVLAVLAILLVFWLIFGMDGDEGADVIPDDVNVTVDVDDGTGGGDGGDGGDDEG